MKRITVFLFCFLTLLACSRKDSPNVIIISVDTLRADCLSLWGGQPDLTPNLNLLAEESVVFKNCFTPVPLTLPAFTSVFTATYPQSHGVRLNKDIVNDKLIMLAEIFHKKGYDTQAVVGGVPLISPSGIGKGFNSYDDVFLFRPATGNPLFHCENLARASNHMSCRPAEDITAVSIEKLSKIKEPFFLFIHYFDPHSPYFLHEKYLNKFKDKPYDGEVAYTDEAIGRLLKYLKNNNLYDDSLIVFFADHGEGLGEHNEDEHGYYLFNSTIKIPLMWKVPLSWNKLEKQRYDEWVSLVDISPTLLELLNIEDKNFNLQMQGISLAKHILGGTVPSAERMIIGITKLPELYFGWQSLSYILNFPYKAILSSEPAIYDLNEVEEENNLIEKKRNIYDKMSHAYKEIEQQLPEYCPEEVVISSEKRKKLTSLGYLGSYVTEKLADPENSLPPSAWPAYVRRMRSVWNSLWNGNQQEAIRILKETLKKDNKDFKSLLQLAEIYQSNGEHRDALELLQQAVNIDADNRILMFQLLELKKSMGDYQGMQEILDQIVEQYGLFYDVIPHQVFINNVRQDYEANKKLLNQAIENFGLKPEIAILYLFNLRNGGMDRSGVRKIAVEWLEKGGTPAFHKYLEGSIALMDGDQSSALSAFKESCHLGATFFQPYLNAGDLLKGNGKIDEALSYFHAAYMIQPSHPRILHEKAYALAMAGEWQEAYQYFALASKHEPKNPSIKINLMKAAWMLEKKQKAFELFRDLAGSMPKDLENLKSIDPIVKEIGSQVK